MQTAIPPTVMVINDDALQLRLTGAWLEKEGLHVLACRSAEEALRLLLRGTTVDVIVTDLPMPPIDGWRLCHLLRSPEYDCCPCGHHRRHGGDRARQDRHPHGGLGES